MNEEKRVTKEKKLKKGRKKGSKIIPKDDERRKMKQREVERKEGKIHEKGNNKEEIREQKEKEKDER